MQEVPYRNLSIGFIFSIRKLISKELYKQMLEELELLGKKLNGFINTMKEKMTNNKYTNTKMNKNSKIYIAGHRGLVGSAIVKILNQKVIQT